MDLQVKKLKVNIYITPRQNSLPCPYHFPQSIDKLLILPVNREDYENLFQNVLLSVNVFKTCNRRMNFLLKGPFGDIEQKPGGYSYWVLVTLFLLS